MVDLGLRAEQMNREHDRKRAYLNVKCHVVTGNFFMSLPRKVNTIGIEEYIGKQREQGKENKRDGVPECERLTQVTFTEDYPGGLVPELSKPIPRGTVIVLPSQVALRLQAIFGWVELKPLGAG